MKVNHSLRSSVMEAWSEVQKMKQKTPFPAQVLHPLKSDASSLTVEHVYHEKDAPSAPQKGTDSPTPPQRQQTAAPSPREVSSNNLSVKKRQSSPVLHAKHSLAEDLKVRNLRRAIVLSEILAPPLALRRKR